MGAKEELEKYLKDNGISFEEMVHAEVYTSQEVAAAQHVRGQELAKVVMANADGDMVMLVLPASYRVDFDKLKSVLGKTKVSLAKEEEFQDVFPGCEVGAMPPFGNLYNISVYADKSLTVDPEIIFQAGTHVHTMKIKYADYERLAKPKVADFAVHLA
ncbi:MAG: YbaK/EbsC family protein [Actinomycetota bacterium]